MVRCPIELLQLEFKRSEHSDTEFYHRKAGEPLHAEREPLSVLREIQREMGPDAWAAQYQLGASLTSLTVTVIAWSVVTDGYVSGATIFSDANNNLQAAPVFDRSTVTPTVGMGEHDVAVKFGELKWDDAPVKKHDRV